MVDKWLDAPQTKVDYLESDGEPMGETGIHSLQILNSMGVLRAWFRHRLDVYVGANMFMYYTEGNPADVVAPDLFVVLNTHKEERRTWKIWGEGKAPDFVIEFTSEATKGKVRWFKRGLYEELGIQEYFQFDPLKDYMKPQLQGYYLDGKQYQPIEPEFTEGGYLQLKSRVLNLYLRNEGDDLRFYEVESGVKLLTLEEAEEELVRLRAEYEKLKNQLEA
ncbi:MAG: Uma2 family endonuclease [Chloroflexi bacterium]|nr:Uma2 family endonuclease [Chloroflexota bacterium]